MEPPKGKRAAAAVLMAAALLSASCVTGKGEARAEPSPPSTPVPLLESSPEPFPGPSPEPSPIDSPASPEPMSEASPAPMEPLAFKEIWAYLMAGEESFLEEGMPVSDLGYFGAGLSSAGGLIGIPKRDKLKGFKGRVHLVVAETSNKALTHFALRPGSAERKKLLAALESEARRFEGIQIDFEAVLGTDEAQYLSFLKSLKIRIGAKTLSVAVPARTKKVDDAYDYAALAAIADRIIVMAYDEHWSGSEPGPVSSIEWCGRVADYAKTAIPAERLVMGSPFYGRAWASVNPARAYKNSSVARLIDEKGIGDPERSEGILRFSYEERVLVDVYYDDAASILARLGAYAEKGVRKVAFWRLGQEDPEAWETMRLSR
jgi:spore germination protein